MFQEPSSLRRKIVELGHNLGLSVVGDGVETPEVLGELASTGCDVAQGDVFTCPKPANELAPWLARYRSGDSRQF